MPLIITKIFIYNIQYIIACRGYSLTNAVDLISLRLYFLSEPITSISWYIIAYRLFVYIAKTSITTFSHLVWLEVTSTTIYLLSCTNSVSI